MRPVTPPTGVPRYRALVVRLAGVAADRYRRFAGTGARHSFKQR
jgi:hypothetical protein